MDPLSDTPEEMPESYIWSEEERQPFEQVEPNAVPVIDLHGLWHFDEETEKTIIQELAAACRNGYFQVINHGVPSKLLESMELQGRRLFALPTEQKLRAKRAPQGITAMGLGPHTDSHFITLLYQGDVEGLHYLRNGKWIVAPVVPNALVVNLGDLLEILSNGRYKSPIHRAVPNQSRSRISVAYLCGPPYKSVIEPHLMDSEDPPVYKSVTRNQFLMAKGVAIQIKARLTVSSFRPDSEGSEKKTASRSVVQNSPVGKNGLLKGDCLLDCSSHRNHRFSSRLKLQCHSKAKTDTPLKFRGILRPFEGDPSKYGGQKRRGFA
eukprot:Gb_34356 [translate_table: standard]